MRRALTWLAGLAGIAALLRRRSRQRLTAPPTLPSSALDPAVELRQKLDETRTPAAEQSAEPQGSLSLDERRARVHERATEAITQMRSPDDDPKTG